MVLVALAIKLAVAGFVYPEYIPVRREAKIEFQT
jgi:hypothetical protein